MKKTRAWATAVLGMASCLLPHTTWAQQSGIKRTDLQRHDVSIPGRELVQARFDLPSGAVAPRHSHPGEELVYVIEGVIEYQFDGSPPVTLRAGDSLFVPAGKYHVVKNVGSGNAAELLTFITEKGKPLVTFAK